MSLPPVLPAPTFGAVCARCNHPFQTSRWQPPHNTLCPACLFGMAKAEFRQPMFDPSVTFRINTHWGVGS